MSVRSTCFHSGLEGRTGACQWCQWAHQLGNFQKHRTSVRRPHHQRPGQKLRSHRSGREASRNDLLMVMVGMVVMVVMAVMAEGIALEMGQACRSQLGMRAAS